MATANFLVLEFFVFAVVRATLVTEFLQTSSKTNITLCSYVFKSKGLEKGPSFIFQTIGKFVFQKLQSQHDQAQTTYHKG